MTTPANGAPWSKNLGDILRLPALGDRPAYVDLRDYANPQSYSVTELDRLVSAIARGLRSRHVGPDERVAILSANRAENIAAYLAIMRNGSIAVPVNHKLPKETIEYIFKDSDVRFAFVDEARTGAVPAPLAKVSFDANGGAEFRSFLDYGASPITTPSAQDIAEILYTSGSTGIPKGVPLTHAGQLWALSHYLTDLTAQASINSTLVAAPFYHMNGLFTAINALANRVTVISLPVFDARRYLAAVEQYECTALTGIPTMFALMVREKDLIQRLNLRSVQDVKIGSAPLTDSLLRHVQQMFPNANVTNGYGTTEAGPAVFGAHPDGIVMPPLSVGYPMPGVDWNLLPDKSAEQGVLALKTPALTPGYLNLPEVTREKMIDGWYITGDVLRRDAQGFFFFVGRSDDMFVCGGENVYPGEVEKLLERHPDVAQAVVVGAPDDIKGQIPIAFIVPRGNKVKQQTIKDYALNNGPAYAHPRFVIFKDVLPVSGTHKIDRTVLTREAAELTQTEGRSGRL